MFTDASRSKKYQSTPDSLRFHYVIMRILPATLIGMAGPIENQDLVPATGNAADT